MKHEFVGRTQQIGSILEKLRAQQSVLLMGPAGTGKSRLAEAIGDRLGATHAVDTIRGTPSMRNLAFGAVSHLLGDAPMPDPAFLLQRLVAGMVAKAGDRPALLIVDDIDQLDDGAAGFTQLLAEAPNAVVLATVRTGEGADERITALWKDGLFEREQVDALDRPTTDALVDVLVATRADDRLKGKVWALTEGNPLYVRELVMGALEAGQIDTDGGTAVLSGALVPTPRLADLISQRIASLDAAPWEALRLISLCQPVPLRQATTLVEPELLSVLEDRQLLAVDESGDVPAVRTSHPLIAEVVVDTMPVIERSVATVRLAHALLSDPATNDTGVLRAAVWLLDASEALAPDPAVRAAATALRNFDGPLALRLSDAAIAAGAGAAADLVRGRALIVAGDGTGAADTLRAALEQADDEMMRVQLTVALSETLMWSNEPTEALAVLRRSLDGLADPVARAMLGSRAILASGVLGDFDLGEQLGPELLSQSDLPAAAELSVLMPHTLTQTMTGRLDGVEASLARAAELAELCKAEMPFARDQIGLNRALAYQASGRFSDSVEHVRNALSAGVGLPGAWLFIRNNADMFTGDVTGGLRASGEAIQALQRSDPFGVMPMALAAGAILQSMMADTAPALDTIDRARSLPTVVQPRNAVYVGRAEAWMAAVDGDPARGAELAVKAARAAIEATHSTYAVWALADAVRFGHPELAVEDLRVLAGEGRGPLATLVADHAVALVENDRDALTEVTLRYAAGGAWAVVAECHRAASRMADDRGDDVAATRHRHLVLETLTRCAGYNAPWLQEVEPPLSPRQSEIARMAASGAPTRQIATDLHLSTRTVENHLRTVYATFDLAGRHELPPLFPEL